MQRERERERENDAIFIVFVGVHAMAWKKNFQRHTKISPVSTQKIGNTIISNSEKAINK
jgi:hypothetical protein